MLSPSRFRAIVSGRERGVGAALLRGLLRVAEVPYTSAVRRRNRRFDAGKLPITQVEMPVISVGNLTLGGTGKTPMVAWLARWFRRHNVRVSIISRGYGAKDGSRNDEALELEERLPDVPHLQNPDRVEAAQVAIEEFETELIILDDAMQNRFLARDLNIVLIDALEPFGFDHVFPRGTLREPLSGLARADVVALSRADMLDEPERRQIEQRVRQYAPNVGWAEVTHAPQSLINSQGDEQPLDTFAGKSVAAFCGIGNPAGFRHTLTTCGYELRTLREFPDHHDYSRADVEALYAWAESLDVEAILCTHKDLVKLGISRLGKRPLWAVAIGLEFLAGRERFEQRLQALLEQSARVQYQHDQYKHEAQASE